MRRSLAFRVCLRESPWDKPLRRGEGGTGLGRGKVSREVGPPPQPHPIPRGALELETLLELSHGKPKCLGLSTPTSVEGLPASSSLLPSKRTARGCLPTALQQLERSPSLKGHLSRASLYLCKCIHGLYLIQRTEADFSK